MEAEMRAACASRDAAHGEFERLEAEVARLSRALEVEEEYTASKVAAWRRRHWGMEDEVRRLEDLLQEKQARCRQLEDRVATAKVRCKGPRPPARWPAKPARVAHDPSMGSMGGL